MFKGERRAGEDHRLFSFSRYRGDEGAQRVGRYVFQAESTMPRPPIGKIADANLYRETTENFFGTKHRGAASPLRIHDGLQASDHEPG
jgi:hypothetical protein